MRFQTVIATGILLTAVPPPVAGQIRASERGTITQVIDGTTITVDYARPRMRGRSAAFGQEVHWEEVWTPGANMATTLEISKDIQLNGHPVPKGKYSLWMVVRKGDWTVLLDTTVNRFHTDRPDESKVALQFKVRPERNPRTEVLAWTFPEIRSDGGVLAMEWDTVKVSLKVKVESSYPLMVSADVARPLVGKYEMRWLGGPPEPETADSAAPSESGGGSPPTVLEVTYSSGSLWAKVTPPPFPGYDTVVFLRLRDDWFIPGWWMNGELFDASDDMTMEFNIENGKATGFEMRLKTDEVIARASRVQ